MEQPKNGPDHDPTLTVAIPIRLAAGSEIAHYRLDGFLGAGGMGQVYGATDQRLGRSVAIKLLPSASHPRSDWVERFTREARAASALNHPNIVTVYETGECEAGRYIAMEMVEGRTLRARIAEGLSAEDALEFALQMAKALAAAHAAGIVHRDIKPDNIMVREDGYIKVLDFGLAHVPADLANGEGTVVGPVMGTLRYMSPEQGLGQPAGTPSDLFSLGLVFYEMVTGRHPFHSATPQATFQTMLSEQAIPPSALRPALPSLLDDLILAMLLKLPEHRPPAGRVARVLLDLRSGIALPAFRQVAPAPKQAAKIVGREEERAQLSSAAGISATGRGLLVGIAGEAGLGKSTLVEDFLTGLSHDVPLLIGRGRCSERAAAAEAHLPLLGALQSLIAFDASGFAARSIRLLAPLWYKRVGPAVETGLLAGDETVASSPERLKWELAALFEALAAHGRLLLVLEDIHWADDATIGVMSFLSSQFDRLGLLLIVTFRESELLQNKHPFLHLKLDLQARRLCREIVLSFLSEREVARYLSLEFPENRFPADFASRIHARTQGHPLFLADLLRYLRDRGAVIQENGVWILSGAFAETEHELPESVRSMVQLKMQSVSEDDLRLLAAASVQGHEFDSAVLAKVLKLDALEVEERLERIERLQRFVRAGDERDMPDGTLSCRYQFVHNLYQTAFHDTLRPTRRAALSGATARALCDFYGARKSRIASRLAPLFALAREWAQAAEHYLQASHSAGYSFAFKEAATLARRGIEAAQNMPASTEKARMDRAKLELALQLALGRPLAFTGGASAPEAVACFRRASELAREIGDDVEIFPAIFGLFTVSVMAGECREALSFGRQLQEIAIPAGDPILLAHAHHAVAVVSEVTGDFAEAERHLNLVLALERRGNADYVANFGVDPVIGSEWIKARLLWMKGFPDQARKQVRATLQRIEREEMDLRSACYALVIACNVYQYCGDVPEVLALAARGTQFCQKHGFEAELHWFAFFEGWALFSSGDVAGGLAKMRAGMEFLAASGVRLFASAYATIFAGATIRQGEWQEASRWIAWALEFGAQSGYRYAEPELYRLKAECKAAEGNPAEAEADFERAMALSREQGARSLELRIAMSLARFRQAHGKPVDGQRLVSEIYGEFTEGLDTADLAAARELVASLETQAVRN